MLTTGASHVLTGAGQIAIAQPVGLSISMASIPSYIGRDPGPPILYHRIGSVSLGHALGWTEPQELQLVPQLVYPIEPEYTLLAYALVAGVSATVLEISSSSNFPVRAMPWDRAPTLFQQQSTVGLPNGGPSTMWSFTVPAGRMLWLSTLECWVRRIATPSLLGSSTVQINRSGLPILQVLDSGQPIGYENRETLPGEHLILFPGETIAATMFSTETGTNHVATAFASGFTFAV